MPGRGSGHAIDALRLAVTAALLLALALPARADPERPLTRQLDMMRAMTRSMMSTEQLDAVFEAIEYMRRCGVVEKHLKTGQQAPDFTLPGTSGRLVRSEELRARGPLVLAFYWGHW